MTLPCLLYAGEDDPVCAENNKCAAVMPNVPSSLYLASVPGTARSRVDVPSFAFV